MSANPIIKQVRPINFLYFHTRTSMQEIPGLVGHIQEKLYREAADKQLFVSGPAYWNYFNVQDVSLPFDLEISLPIGRRPNHYAGEYRFKTSAPFRCLSRTVEGDWSRLAGEYGLMMAYAREHRFKLTGETREVYINIDFEDPEAQSTEIQIGIA